MDIYETPELESLKERMLEAMIEYASEGDVDYTEEHVRQCGDILEEYSGALNDAKDREQALGFVQEAVEALNALNLEAGEELIETEQREDICEYILQVGVARGFFQPREDVTEPWREW